MSKANSDKKVQKMLVGKKPGQKGRPSAKAKGKAKAKAKASAKAEVPIEEKNEADDAEEEADDAQEEADDAEKHVVPKDEKKPRGQSADLSKDWAVVESWLVPIMDLYVPNEATHPHIM